MSAQVGEVYRYGRDGEIRVSEVVEVGACGCSWIGKMPVFVRFLNDDILHESEVEKCAILVRRVRSPND